MAGKERDTGPRPGDRQPNHEQRSNQGSRPSGTGTSIGGTRSGTIYRRPGGGTKKK